MTDVLVFALLGIGAGAAYAIAAMGLVVVYRGSGVVNFAHVGTAVFAAYVYAKLLDAGVPEVLAVAAGLATAALIGLATHVLIMQRMQHASTLSRVVATLGVLLVLQSSAELIWGGEGIELLPSMLPDDRIDILGAAVTADRLWLAGLSVVAGIVLWAVYRFTRFGRLTTAVAENSRAVATLGRSPQRIAMLNWVIGSTLSGAAGILLAPVVGLSVPQIGLLLIPALAAALVGGFSSFGLAWAGAMAIGIIQSEITRYVPAPGWAAAVPILIIIVILFLRGHALPQRGTTQERLPEVGSGRMRPWLIALLGGIVIVLVFVVSSEWIDAITISLITALICLSIVVLTGYAGQLSLAQFALAGIAALIAARSAAALGLPLIVAAVLAIVATTAIGLLVALPALRMRGVSLGIVTLGIAVVAQQVLLTNPAYTGGITGTTIESPSIGDFSLDATAYPARYALLCLAILVVAGVLVSNLRRGTLGRRLLAVRSSERAAASLGVDVTRSKLYAFAISAALASTAGVLLAFRTTTVTFGGYLPQRSIDVLGSTVIGGLGYIGGGFLAGLFSAGGPISYALHDATGSRMWLNLIVGAVMLATVTFAPNGMFAWKIEIGRWMAARFAGRRGAKPATAPAKPLTVTEEGRARRKVQPRTLIASGVSVAFGGVRALDDVSLRVEPGQVLGVIGPNGAGKTTLIDVLTGLTHADGGTVTLDGKDITHLPVWRRARSGIVRSYQGLELFDDLTVLDNISVPSATGGRAALLRELIRPPRQRVLGPAAATAVAELGLSDVLDKSCSELSYGQRRLVAIARALAAEPSVLLLDEPAAGLDDEDRAELSRLIRRLVEDLGIAVLIVEHDVQLVVDVSDRVLVLDGGRVIAEQDPQEVLRMPEVIDAYLGGSHATAGPGTKLGGTE
ncbi:ABC transporter permease subunit [Microbacterium sp. RD1]|uniref:ABC transporter permease subunit n=1 Tax=Microbacterium sp. RD1 TaxID=3457313 RepID=UPI003FA56037